MKGDFMKQDDGALSTYEPKLAQSAPQPQTLFGTSKKVAKANKKAQRASGYPYDLKQKRKLRKNNREKQRRSELNVKFEKLCTLLGRQAKAEKYTILTDAINLIGELRHENQELKIEKNGLRKELVSASVGPGVTEQDIEKALLAAFPDAPALPLDLTPPGSPEPGNRHLASSDDSEDEEASERTGGAQDGYSVKLEGVAGLTMGSPKAANGVEPYQQFPQALPSSHLPLSSFSSLLYKPTAATPTGYMHPQTFSPFPSSFAPPSFPSQYHNPVINFHGMMPLSMPSLEGLDHSMHPPLMPDNVGRASSSPSPSTMNPHHHHHHQHHLNQMALAAAMNSQQQRAYPHYSTTDDSSSGFNMDQREDSSGGGGNTFLSF